MGIGDNRNSIETLQSKRTLKTARRMGSLLSIQKKAGEVTHVMHFENGVKVVKSFFV
jgi:hypothetical protein